MKWLMPGLSSSSNVSIARGIGRLSYLAPAGALGDFTQFVKSPTTYPAGQPAVKRPMRGHRQWFVSTAAAIRYEPARRLSAETAPNL